MLILFYYKQNRIGVLFAMLINNSFAQSLANVACQREGRLQNATAVKGVMSSVSRFGTDDEHANTTAELIRQLVIPTTKVPSGRTSLDSQLLRRNDDDHEPAY